MNSGAVYLSAKNNSWKRIKMSNNETWKGKSRLWGDGMHRIASYVAMFTPSFANYFIKKYTKRGDKVLDTFSGRGTTLLEGRILGRKSYALDLNPLAYVLSRAKSESFVLDDVINKINALEKEFSEYKGKISWDQDMEIYYSIHNLKQISFLKERLGKRWKILNPIENYVLALLIGIMHGPMRKDGSSMYLSLSMSNHTSMSKGYVKRYAESHNLTRPKSNVFEKIRDRAEKVNVRAKFYPNNGEVKYGDALNLKRYYKDLNPDLVLTSPPYLNIINYTNSNWIKMWLLGYENYDENKKIGLDDNHKLSDYVTFMSDYFESLSKILKKGSTLALVIGNVRHDGKDWTFESMWEAIRRKFPKFSLEEVYTDSISQSRKATNSLGLRAGKATRIDKVYIFKVK